MTDAPDGSVEPEVPVELEVPVEPEVIVERRGRLGLLTLNRPRAINALSHEMVRTLAATLELWRDDPDVATVAIVGRGDRGLCAGGDVLTLYRDAKENGGRGSAAFWGDEYTLNLAISHYPKPYVAIQDGIVLGGGVGVSAHGSHRIVTERTRIGFPETTIGFIPDVGATWLLSRAPGRLGTRLALSSESIGAADAILVGFSDTFVPSDRIPRLLAALETDDADVAIAALADTPAPGVLAAQRTWTDEAFSAPTVVGILERLRAAGEPDAESGAAALAATIGAKSPTALAVTLEAVRRAADLPDLAAALVEEYRVSRHAATSHDFSEGIRAQLVDKDRDPHWEPAEHDAVTDAAVAAYFEAPPEGDLSFRASKEMA
jgi:enoyl-CoA hydratase